MKYALYFFKITAIIFTSACTVFFSSLAVKEISLQVLFSLAFNSFSLLYNSLNLSVFFYSLVSERKQYFHLFLEYEKKNHVLILFFLFIYFFYISYLLIFGLTLEAIFSGQDISYWLLY